MNKRINRIVQRIWNLSQAFVVPSCKHLGLHQIRTVHGKLLVVPQTSVGKVSFCHANTRTIMASNDHHWEKWMSAKWYSLQVGRYNIAKRAGYNPMVRTQMETIWNHHLLIRIHGRKE